MTSPQRSPRRRQPKGIPVGGQFAANRHDEAPSLERKVSLTPSEVVSEARKSASIYARRMNLSAIEREEAVSATIESIWNSYGSKNKEMDGALVNHIARLQAGHAIALRAGFKQGDTTIARSIFHDQVSIEEDHLGRRLSDSERNEMARKIRDEWHDPAHKPALGFHTDYTFSDIDSLDEDDLPDALIDPYDPDSVLMERTSPEMEEALGSAEGRLSPTERKSLRDRAWEIVASNSDAPQPRAKLSTAQRKIVNSAVMSGGGVRSVIDAYDRGESGTHIDALFVPFAHEENGQQQELDEAGRESVVDILRSNSRFADRLWSSALSSTKQ